MSNTIILMSDEHNPFISSVYGHPFVKTPNMERMARMGTVYENAYCPSPLCMPSRSAFQSGRRVHELGAYSNCIIDVRGDFPSYGGVLAEQGVHSAHIGKMDVYADGEKLGYKELLNNKNRNSLGDKNISRRPLAIRAGAAARANEFGVKDTAFDADTGMVDTALRWLQEKAPQLQEPWSLAVNILNPHFPQWNTQPYWDMYEGHADLPAFGSDQPTARHPFADDLRRHFQTDQFTEEQVRGLRRGYYGNVSYVDEQIGRLLDALEAGGWLETTNFIYVSDHGEMLGKFGMWWKSALYEDSARVPCLAVGPDFQPGRRVRTPVDLHDVQASIFRSVGAQRPESWVGQPLQDIPENDPERVVFSEYHGHGMRSGGYLVRKGDWKLLTFMGGACQLFNLADDPNELYDLSGTMPDKVAELERELRSICSPEQENEKAHSFQEHQLRELKRLGEKA